jgi:hypothetical protein
MRDQEKLLLVGPAALFVYTLAERLGAHALAQWPGASFIWYLNLEVFRPFHHWEILLPFGQMAGESGLTPSTWIAGPLLALVCLGLLLKSKLPLAIAAHFALLCSGLILYCSWLTLAGTPLDRFEPWNAPNFVTVIIFLTSLTSASVSHRLYWRDILS